jgi:hypothetical protein
MDAPTNAKNRLGTPDIHAMIDALRLKALQSALDCIFCNNGFLVGLLWVRAKFWEALARYSGSL